MGTIVLKNAQKRFGDVVIIPGVDLEINDSEFVVFVGPSGCGKSTLLRLIAGLEDLSGGDILIDGANVGNVPPAKRGLSMVFQSYALYPHMSVRNNIAFGLKMAGQSKEEIAVRVAKAASVLNLTDYLDRKPRQLSGGQRQRVALARALINRPRVLLLDEPLGALDLKLRQEMQGELKAIQQRLGITFVHVTHDQEEALAMSDRLAVFRDGRIEQVGTPAEVYEHPATAFVADFVGVSNLLEGGAALAVAGSTQPFTVRPEKIRISEEGGAVAAGSCSVAGTIRQVVYLGMHTRYGVEIDPGGRLVVVEQNRDARSMDVLAARGRRVRLIWSSTHNRPVRQAL